jgi:hypothetical protein
MKTINLNLVGLDDNAFSLMGTFSKQAKREGWTSDEIKSVTDEAMTGDYNHLLRTLSNHCEAEEYEDTD